MSRARLLFLVVFALPAATWGQAASPDSQTLQALLSEVRELRKELRISLTRMQSGQILLSRLQTQQGAFTGASERLNDARSKLSDAQTHQKDVRNNLKRFEDALNDEQNPAQQRELRERINISKAELENPTYIEQCQMAEIEAEQDKLNALETQLDELVGKLGNPGNPNEQPAPIRH